MPINPKPINEKENVSPSSKEISFLLSPPVYTFDDIIISSSTKEEIDNALALVQYESLIYDTWNLRSVIKRKRGMSVNLFGPSGAGKTMAAHAIANELDLKILIVDYSEIESKYVGETAKNLVKMFNFAEDHNALILFDEADALLSKRVTMMNSAADVSVNQTRNVLLKILDTYQLPIVFTTNFIENFDSAFYRRITQHIRFDYPDYEMRQKLWEHYLVKELPITGDRSEVINAISSQDSITGADIANIVLSLAVKLARKKIDSISTDSLNGALTALKEFKNATNSYQIITRKITEQEAQDVLKRRI